MKEATRKKTVKTPPAIVRPHPEPPVPRLPITICFVAAFHPGLGDFVRYMFVWELRMQQHITFPRGDIGEPAIMSNVQLLPFAPPWWEWVKGIWQTNE